MMNWFLFISILIIELITSISSEPVQCGINEEYRECRGCDQYCNKGPVACTADCRPGCSCIKGHKRTFPGGPCVPASSCILGSQDQCGINEVYSNCGGCDQYCNEGPVFCTLDCRPGCYCEDGYKRSFRGGICIPDSTCPQEQCRLNEVYKECGGCEQYCNEEPHFCPAYCRPGYYCQDGYIRAFRGGICIPIEFCPRARDVEDYYDYETGPGSRDVEVYSDYESGYQCEGANERYDDCGVGVECEDYCGKGSYACAYCQPGCYCMPGFIRASSKYDAKCIPEAQCLDCGENEIYDKCGVGMGCEDYCGRGPNSCAYCQPGCYCRRGFVRSSSNHDAKCIPKNQC